MLTNIEHLIQIPVNISDWGQRGIKNYERKKGEGHGEQGKGHGEEEMRVKMSKGVRRDSVEEEIMTKFRLF